MRRELEIQHGVSLLQEAHAIQKWSGSVAVTPVDSVCRFNTGDGPCGSRLANAMVMLWEDDGTAGTHVMILCEYHTAVLREALDRWREIN